MHTCPTCSAESGRAGAFLFASREADDLADLRRQAKEAHPEIAALIDGARARLQTQDRGIADLESALNKALRAAVDELRAQVASGAVREQAILGTSISQIRTALDTLLTDVKADLVTTYADLLEVNATAAEKAAGLPAGTTRLDLSALSLLAERNIDAVWDGAVLTPAAKVISDGFANMVSGAPLAKIITRVKSEIGTSVGKAATVARTEIAAFDRAAAEEAAVNSGLDLRIYMGPMDRITRPFCAALVGKVLTLGQIADLDNGQTAVGPIFEGGGYNCRHRWVAVSVATVERRGLPMATEADIKAANAAGAR